MFSLKSKLVVGAIFMFALGVNAVSSLRDAYAVNLLVKGVCYSPFRDGQSPTGASPTREQIIEDIVLVKATFPNASIRMFGIDKPYLKWIPEVCESLSVVYTVASWTSFRYNTWATARNDLVNFQKVSDSLGYTGVRSYLYGYNNAIETSGTFPTEADRATKIALEISATKATLDSNTSLSHEENWDFWLRYPWVADSLSFVSIRIMPQTDLILTPVEAMSYIHACYDTVAKTFPTKKVVISSVGWNTYSSSQSAQKTLLENLVADTLLDYYIFSFTDEKWKGVNEGYYGIFDSKRFPKRFMYDPTPIDFSSLFVVDTMKTW